MGPRSAPAPRPDRINLFSNLPSSAAQLGWARGGTRSTHRGPGRGSRDPPRAGGAVPREPGPGGSRTFCGLRCGAESRMGMVQGTGQDRWQGMGQGGKWGRNQDRILGKTQGKIQVRMHGRKWGRTQVRTGDGTRISGRWMRMRGWIQGRTWDRTGSNRSHRTQPGSVLPPASRSPGGAQCPSLGTIRLLNPL